MPTQKSALGAVLTAVYAALNVAGFTALSSGGVYTDIPRTAAFPYSRIEFITETRWDRFASPGKNVVFAVHVFSQYEGLKEALDIVNKAVELLHYQTLSVTGYAAQRPQYEQTIPAGSDLVDGVETRHLVAEFRIKAVQS